MRGFYPSHAVAAERQGPRARSPWEQAIKWGSRGVVMGPEPPRNGLGGGAVRPRRRKPGERERPGCLVRGRRPWGGGAVRYGLKRSGEIRRRFPGERETSPGQLSSRQRIPPLAGDTHRSGSRDGPELPALLIPVASPRSLRRVIDRHATIAIRGPRFVVIAKRAALQRDTPVHESLEPRAPDVRPREPSDQPTVRSCERTLRKVQPCLPKFRSTLGCAPCAGTRDRCRRRAACSCCAKGQ